MVLGALALLGGAAGIGAMPAEASPSLTRNPIVVTHRAAPAATAPSLPQASAAPLPSDAGQVDVAKVSGLLDPVLTSFVERSVTRAEHDHAVALVLQVNSSGAVVSDGRIARLARRLHDSSVPVAIWVGPSGAKAKGAAAQLVGVVPEVGVAPGSHVGPTGNLAVDRSLLRPAFAAQLARLHDHTIDSGTARTTGIATVNAPVLGELVVNTPRVPTKTIHTSSGTRRQPLTSQVFSQLPVIDQLMHTVASPSVAYLMFVAGMALMLLELFTAGVGVAGLVGAGCFVLGCYGLAVLPANPFGVGLLVLAMLAFAIDVQTGVPRVWTGIGGVAFVAGSLLLYDGMRLPWLTFGIAIVAMAVFVLSGLPALVRTRFSTPTIGREWMIGETGTAVVDIAPDGVVQVRDALWRARTNRATPIRAGEPVEIAEVQGLLLRVDRAERPGDADVAQDGHAGDPSQPAAAGSTPGAGPEATEDPPRRDRPRSRSTEGRRLATQRASTRGQGR